MRRLLLILGVVIGAGLLRAPAHAVGEDSFLSFVSRPGDYIGQGRTYLFTPANAQFIAQISEDHNLFSLYVDGETWWYLDLQASAGQELAPGAYENATRWPFQSPLSPGLSFFGDGRGCNTLRGRFDILETSYGPFGYIERFHAQFEQHCEGGTAALFGEVLITDPPPPPVIETTTSITAVGRASRVSGAGIVMGTLQCNKPGTVDLEVTLRERISGRFVANGSTTITLPCSETPVDWSATINANDSLAFRPGNAEVFLVASAHDPDYPTTTVMEDSALIKLKRT